MNPIAAVSNARYQRHERQLDGRERQLFDARHYASQARRAFRNDDEAWQHYQRTGAADRISPHPLFDAAFYHVLYPDVQHLPDLFAHFIGTGDRELRRPHSLFDPDWYLATHAAANCGDVPDPWTHFLECSSFSPCTPLWDPIAVPGNPEGSAARLQSVDAFTRFLRRELDGLLTPHPLFDAEYVRRRHGAVDLPIPLLQWYAAQLGDQRRDISPNPLFDQAWYLDRYGQTFDLTECPLSNFIRTTPERQSHPSLHGDVWEWATSQRLELAELLRQLRWGGPNARADRTEQSDADLDVLVIDIDNAAISIASSVLALQAASRAGVKARLWILENASESTDEALTLADYLPTATVERTSARRSFGESNNILAERGSAPLLLLLNNDAFLPENAIADLIRGIDDQTIAVGPCLIYPDFTIQECGGRIVEDGSPIQLAKGARALPPHLAAPRPVDYVSAACMLVRRSCFEKVGGFSHVFEPAYFEDTDLCLRLSRLGSIFVLPHVRVVHYEGHSTSRSDVLAQKLEVQAVAREKFVSAYASFRSGESIVAHAAPVASPERRGQPVALIYSPYGLMMGGGERYLLSMAEALCQDWEVQLAFDGPYSQLRLRNIQTALGLPQRSYPLLDVGRGGLRHFRPDLFIAMANSVLPPVPAVGASNIYHCQFPFPHPDDLSTTGDVVLAQWNGVIVNSQFTAEAFRVKCERAGWSVPAVTVVPPPCVEVAPREASQLHVVSVGRFFGAGHSKRQDLAVEAFTELRRRYPEASLTLIGGVGNDPDARAFFRRVLDSVRGLPVRILPDASRLDLERELQESAFYWHFGGLGVSPEQPEMMEHFGIAVVEAMSAGAVPVVASCGGPVEIVAGLSADLLASRVQDYVGITDELWSNPGRYAALRGEAIAAARRYSPEAFADTVSSLAREVPMATRETPRILA